MNSTQTFGDRVKFARKKSKLSQLQLANKIGVTQGTITHIENGRNQDTKHIMDLARALSVRAEWLYYGSGNTRDVWPFDTISQSDYMLLPSEVKKDIEDYIQFKLSKIRENS
ncbi:helix-turn-helix domain-containing protein [Oligella urethralis]|uniref:helix-turn-helix domain-containing protein n=1 Tax=Oligella urethralis TaxID=90245 RepID=UPI0027BAC2B1|nr:helix-turn-helix transcriptional regulator [Oligella urethralis]